MIFYYETLTGPVRLYPDRSCQLRPVENRLPAVAGGGWGGWAGVVVFCGTTVGE